MFFKDSIIHRLRALKAANPVIHSIYLRHSGAHQEPPPFISDLDLIVFVEVRDLEEYRYQTRSLKKKLRIGTLPRVYPLEIIVLPATADVFRLIQHRYFFRSKYPFSSWRNIDSQSDTAPQDISHQYPLDHLPELAMEYYLLPCLLGHRRRRLFESSFIKRKLKSDGRMLEKPAKSSSLLEQYLIRELQRADEIFKSVTPALIEEPIAIGEVSLDPSIKKTASELGILLQRGRFKVICNVHVYPHSYIDNLGYIAFEVAESVNPQEIVSELYRLRNLFPLQRYSIALGTKAASLGRLSFLSRNHILEPFFYLEQGISIFTHSKLPVTLPGPQALRAKFEEFLLCTLIALGEGGIPCYRLYSLLFTIQYAITKRRLITEEQPLYDCFGSEFRMEYQFRDELRSNLWMKAVTDLFAISLI